VLTVSGSEVYLAFIAHITNSTSSHHFTYERRSLIAEFAAKKGKTVTWLTCKISSAGWKTGEL
jgi:hypothetical protein